MNEHSLLNKNEAVIIGENLIQTFELFGIKKISTSSCNYHLLNTGLSDPLLNLVCLPQINNVNDIAGINKFFLEQDLAFCWWIEEDKMSKEILNHFDSDQYIFFGDVPGMIFYLKDYNSFPQLSHSFRIGQILNIDDLKEWTEVLAKSFSFSKESIKMFVDKFSPFLVANDKLILIGAWVDEKLVATASLSIANGVAGFYNDSTLENFRNRGISSALYHVRLQLLKEMGIEKTVIQTSPMATPIAEKIGFKRVNNYKVFLYKNCH